MLWGNTRQRSLREAKDVAKAMQLCRFNRRRDRPRRVDPGVMDILLWRPAGEQTGIGPGEVGRALREAVAAVFDSHVIAEEGC